MNTGHITNDIGRVIPLHKGEYSATTPYELNDCVSFQGSTYWHYKPEKTVGVLPTDETVWRLMTNATDVEPYVERALQAAENAEEARDAAQGAKTGAESAKIAAQTSASNAELAAGRAESAQAAAENARDDAKSARDGAQTAKTNAEAAKTDAEAAQTAAETAKAGAEAAKTNALASATAAYNSEQSALNAKTAAEAAKSAAETAEDNAETAKTAAEAAKTAAEAAKTAAETAQDEAETAQAGAATSAQDAQESAENAEAYAIGKRAGVDVPSTDPAYHNNAKYYAEQAETTTQSVKYVEQTLTDAQKKQARENINATAPDGFYQGMGVGNAEQLISTVGVTDKAPYNFRTSGGSADIGNRLNDKIVGGTICWNQLLDKSKYPATTTKNGVTFTNNGDGTITANGTATQDAWFDIILGTPPSLQIGHKMLLIGCPSGGGWSSYLMRLFDSNDDIGNGKIFSVNTGSLRLLIYIKSGNTLNNLVFKPRLFDLTQMFGSAIADYIYSLEQTTAGAGTAWFKNLFPKPYYEYNAGELLSVCTNAHITRGFNAWDEEWELGSINQSTGTYQSSTTQIRCKNKIRVIPNAKYYFELGEYTSYTFPCFYDENGNFVGTINAGVYGKKGESSNYHNPFTVPANAYSMAFCLQPIYGTTYKHDICINLSWSGYRNGEYEPYVEHKYPLSPIELRGIPKLDSANNLYFDGDTYEKDGTVTRKIVRRILNGTENWNKGLNTSNEHEYYYLNLGDYGSVIDHKAICDKYMQAEIQSANTVVAIDVINSTGRNMAVLMIRPVNVADMTVAQFKALLASSPVTVEYGISTPTTETANPFTDPQIVDDFGTEEYVDALATAETSPRDVEVPVGHEAFYHANLRDKLQNLPTNASADGLYLVKQTGNKQELIAYTPESELPTIQTEGTYVLKSVNGVLTWVLES